MLAEYYWGGGPDEAKENFKAGKRNPFCGGCPPPFLNSGEDR